MSIFTVWLISHYYIRCDMKNKIFSWSLITVSAMVREANKSLPSLVIVNDNYNNLSKREYIVRNSPQIKQIKITMM